MTHFVLGAALGVLLLGLLMGLLGHIGYSMVCGGIVYLLMFSIRHKSTRIELPEEVR